MFPPKHYFIFLYFNVIQFITVSNFTCDFIYGPEKCDVSIPDLAFSFPRYIYFTDF